MPDTCEICGRKKHPLAYACKRCNRFIHRVDIRKKPDKQARVWALKAVWDGEHFRCHFSGAPLEETNRRSPRYLTFDHRTPGDESDIVVAAALINDMKSDMTEHEFRFIVKQLARRFEGGTFDVTALKLSLWRR